MEKVSIGKLGTISYALPWQVLESRYSNAHELIRLPQPPFSSNAVAQDQKAPSANGPLARLLITTEKRSSPEEAVKRLLQLAVSRAASVRFYALSGWPAVELQFTQKLPRRGQQNEPGETSQDYAKPTPTVQRAIVAGAVEDEVVTFDIMLAPEASKEVLPEGLKIADSFAASRQDNPEDLRRSLQQLGQDYDKNHHPGGPPEHKRPSDEGSLEEKAGTAQIQSGGNGELEVVTSANGNTIVIASNTSLTRSTNGGGKFTGANFGIFRLNDPTLGRGTSGDFYLGQIALPTGAANQKNVSGCTNAVSRSTNGGSSFGLRGFSAVCPLGPIASFPPGPALPGTLSVFCFPDQPHIAADSFTPGASEQVYAVWRMIGSLNLSGNGPTSCTGATSGTITPSISCSQDSGANWTAPAAISGFDDFPRLAVGKDGKLYVVGMNGDSVVLTRFSSCRNGLVPDSGFPVTVASLSGQVNCPVPGLDRCNNGNALSSPTVAPDPSNAEHVSVSFAEADGSGGERVVTMDSHDSGATFPTGFTVSFPSSARRFMPWSCMTGGNTFVGWYDRGKATSARNDLTDYVVGGNLLATPKNLSNNPDPQCAKWPCSPRSQNDSGSCSVPELAGVCLNGSGQGTRKCNFSSPNCPSGTSCQTGIGCPKYGDYNGMACANNLVIAAWASATAPKGLPRPSGISIFSQTFAVKKTGPPTFDQIQIITGTGNDNAGNGLELVATVSGQKRALCLKPSTSLPPDGICSNGSGALDQNEQDTWDNWTSRSETYTLDTPKDSTDNFKTITITSLQSSCQTFCDNWDLQKITVIVSDSSKKLKPVVLLNIANPPDPNNSDNCIARLKAPPNLNSVTYNLNAAKPGSSPSNFGPAPPGSCPQKTL
jgi:hypothetical protein